MTVGVRRLVGGAARVAPARIDRRLDVWAACPSPRLDTRAALASLLLLLTAGAARAGEDRAAATQPRLFVFTWRSGVLGAPPEAPAGALPVGSLSKPFVARAWARSHPGVSAPFVRCTTASHCWNTSGHGTVGLARAVAISCNTYFLDLATQVPVEAMARTLRAAGFRPPDPLTPAAAIGLSSEAGPVSAEPAAILAAYSALLREAWPGAEPIRTQLLAGLRDSARSGTASGLAHPGFHAKTGTVPSLDGRSLSTSGWTVAIDESDRGFLALLTPGTGRDTARALGRWLRAGGAGPADLTLARTAGERHAVSRDHARATSAGQARVTVSLFSALAPRRVLARNLGAAPLASTRRGFVGGGAEIELRAGDRLAEGDWELRVPANGLRRRIRGALRVDAGTGDVLRLRAELAHAEYVAGVIAAELPAGRGALRLPLGAAALRFLAEGPRHGDADRCDLTHCAFFIGRGPRADWRGDGRQALLSPPDGDPAADGIDGNEWREMLGLSRQPGPARWSSHCGGQPLSPHAVWGGGDRRVFACDRHGVADRAPWSRRWTRDDVLRAFGEVEDLRVGEDDGTWRLELAARGARRSLTWDQAHARLADVRGWGALPSPADRVWREGGDYRAEGRGLGHRVGLCLEAARETPPH